MALRKRGMTVLNLLQKEAQKGGGGVPSENEGGGGGGGAQKEGGGGGGGVHQPWRKLMRCFIFWLVNDNLSY